MGLHAALAAFKAAVDTAVKAAVAPGAAPDPVQVPGLSGETTAEQKRQLPGSLLELLDGSVVMVPLAGGVASTTAGTEVTTKVGAASPGTKRSLDWLAVNVQQIAVGVLSSGGRAGYAAGSLQIAGVQVELWPADSPITELTVSAAGGGSITKSVREALASAGASWRSWDGGLVQPPLLTSAPLPSLADAMAASTSRSRLSTGGGDLASGFLRPAKLEPLGLLDPVGVDAAANFVALLAGRPHAARPLALVLACSGTILGASPPPDVAAVGAARQGLSSAPGGLLDEVSPAMLNDAAARLAALRGEGLAADHSGGHTLAQALAASLASAPHASRPRPSTRASDSRLIRRRRPAWHRHRPHTAASGCTGPDASAGACAVHGAHGVRLDGALAGPR